MSVGLRDGSNPDNALGVLSGREYGAMRRELIEERATALGLVTLGTLRERLGWSTKRLAAYLGVWRNTVNNWEALDRRPQPAQLERLAELYGVPSERMYLRPYQPVGRPPKE